MVPGAEANDPRFHLPLAVDRGYGEKSVKDDLCGH
jgi:hypothetical protein